MRIVLFFFSFGVYILYTGPGKTTFSVQRLSYTYNLYTEKQKKSGNYSDVVTKVSIKYKICHKLTLHSLTNACKFQTSKTKYIISQSLS